MPKGAINLTEGASVKLKNDGRFGKVLSLRAEKIEGQRGRPTTWASVIHEDATEGSYRLSELKSV